MATILGLDIGANSIGWSLVTDKSILDLGVHIFPEGVEDLGDKKEQSKNAARTVYRQTRRRFYRRFLRRTTLLHTLQKHGLAPQNETDLMAWHRLKPYELRSKAVNENNEKLSLLEIGRVFYHLNQRRGFETNSKRAVAQEEDEKNKGAIFKGSADRIGIDDTNKAIKEYRTLGEYLHTLMPQEKESYEYEQLPTRIRARYTTRAMYKAEYHLGKSSPPLPYCFDP